MKPRLTFRGDGTFTIVQFTDVHWKKGDDLDAMSRRLMQNVLQQEKPDFVVFTGDTIYSTECDDPAASFHQAVAVVEEAGIPWAAVFGNHDTEIGITREELMAAIQDCRYGLSEAGPNTLSGVGNYALTIGGSSDGGGTAAARLYFLDSGEYAPEPIGGYSWVKPDQIAWYLAESKAAEQEAGHVVPSLAFFHIPFPEYDQLWQAGGAVGMKQEDVCCPKVNSGLFAAMLERGDVMATFVGHDHLNDYDGDWYGIHLFYGRATGYNTYGFDHRGARIIRMKEGSRELESWIRLDSGEVVTYNKQGGKQE